MDFHTQNELLKSGLDKKEIGTKMAFPTKRPRHIFNFFSINRFCFDFLRMMEDCVLAKEVVYKNSHPKNKKRNILENLFYKNNWKNLFLNILITIKTKSYV